MACWFGSGLQKQVFRLLGLLLVVLFLGNGLLTAYSFGGTNGLFSRMETMISDLTAAKAMSAEEATQLRQQVRLLRDHVKIRIEANGGWVNPVHDQDLYAEIDQVNKPLFERHRAFKEAQGNKSP